VTRLRDVRGFPLGGGRSTRRSSRRSSASR
jgi:hypothetical protein